MALLIISRFFTDGFSNVIRELRSRKTFEKPSVKKREMMSKAIYVQKLQLQDE